MAIFKSPAEIRKHIKSIVRIWFFIALIFLLTTCNQSNPPPSNRNITPSLGLPLATIQCSAHSSNPITLTMYYGSEKQQWIEDVVKDFNSRGISACDGPIHVNATPLGSGESMQKILQGARPDIWSPAGRVWLDLLNAEWRKLSSHNSDLVATTSIDSPSLIISPIVIAMWKSQAQRLGWPQKPLGWSDIATLSTKGWAAYGHPEWGKFQFAHTNPDSSNSGLDAVIAEYYAALDKASGLSIPDVNDGLAQNFVTGIERSIIYYGESTGFFADQMCKKGPGYLSAAVLYESLVVEMNEGKLSSACPEPVVAIYPKEGTFYRVAVMLLLDTSGSMNYLVDGIPKIEAAKQGLKQFIGLLSDSDWAGLTTFSTNMHALIQVSPLSSTRQEMLNEIDGVSAGGDTRLYNSIADQVHALNALSSHYIKAIVVLTDGVDTIHQLSLAQLLKEITPTNPSTGNEVRIFTIAYGDQSYIDVDGLTRIAEATGGQKYAGTTQSIQQVYEQISQFFTNS